MELATHDGYEIGWAKFDVEQKTGPVFGVVPYETLVSICKMADKDVWVCCTRGALFALPGREAMAFKGGTSLSPTTAAPKSPRQRRDQMVACPGATEIHCLSWPPPPPWFMSG